MKKLYLAVLFAVCAAACGLPSLTQVVTLSNIQLPNSADTKTTWNSADYAGKPILMVFMGSWCPYCKMTMPAVDQLQKEYADRVEIVAILVDQDPAAVQNAVKEHGFRSKALYQGNELAESLGVQGLPHSSLFDKKHQLVTEWEGFDPDFANKVRAQLSNIL